MSASGPRELSRPDFGKAAASYNVRPEYLNTQIDLVASELGITSSSDIADVGAGTGKLSKKFSGRCRSITLFEPSLEMIREAGKTMQGFEGEVRIRQASYEYLGHVEKKFDAMVVGDAAHWFGDAEAATKEFRRVLKPGAKIAVFSRQPDSNSPVVKRLHELLLLWDNDKSDERSYSHPNSNWVVKNDNDLDRKQGEHLIDPESKKFITNLMVMNWTKEDLLQYLQSRSSSSKKSVADPAGAMREVIDPLFREFENEVVKVERKVIVDGNEKIISVYAINFPYQSGVLVGALRNIEKERFTGMVAGSKDKTYDGKL